MPAGPLARRLDDLTHVEAGGGGPNIMAMLSGNVGGGSRSPMFGKPARFGHASSNDYAKTFFDAHPDKKGKVVVHHAVEQQVQKRYPGLVSDAELHSLENLRGIPKGEINNRIHLSKIRKRWNQFYRDNPNPTQQDLLDFATKIDDEFGHLFDPPVR